MRYGFQLQSSAATAAVDAAPNTPAAGAPAISGTAQVGETLTADTSSIEDEDGLNEVGFGYQWIAEGSDIDESTGSGYALTEDEKGLTVRVRVSFTDAAGNGESLTSEATAALEPRPNSPATGQPTISGTNSIRDIRS